jgi:hypothetical protein
MVTTARELWEAAEDLRFLLNREYPRDASLHVVGNRYNLDRDGRHLLRRAVFPDAIAEERGEKRVAIEELRGAKLAVDGYNCIITLESALKGKTICLADDGFVRDISGVSSGYHETPQTAEALGLIMDLLQFAATGETLFLLDSPISGSGALAARIRTLMQGHGIRGDASAIKVPERRMAGYKGIIASSDTAVIDQSDRVFDLAGYLITERLHTPLINMKQR